MKYCNSRTSHVFKDPRRSVLLLIGNTLCYSHVILFTLPSSIVISYLAGTEAHAMSYLHSFGILQLHQKIASECYDLECTMLLWVKLKLFPLHVLARLCVVVSLPWGQTAPMDMKKLNSASQPRLTWGILFWMPWKARELPHGQELGSGWWYREFTIFPADISREMAQLLHLAQTHPEFGE